MRGVLSVLGGLFLLLVAGLGIFIVTNQVPDQSMEELKQRWAAPPSQFIEISGMQVHLRDEGPKEDLMPILLLHGTSSSLHTWDGWVHALRNAHRVIRFDMPGFGLTGPSPENNYTIETYARLVVAVLDRFNIDRCVLGGNSLGVMWPGQQLFYIRLIPPYIGDRFHRQISGSTKVIFNTLGHVPQEEDPAATVTAVIAFLQNRGRHD